MDDNINIREKFNDISFNEEFHRYTKNGEDYISVTTLIGKYKSVFERDKVAKKVAERDGVPEEILKQMWQMKNYYSRNLGTEFHFYVETFLMTNIKVAVNHKIEHRLAAFHRFLQCYKDEIEVVDVEFIVYDENYKLAGTVDCLCRNKKTGKYFIVDWKTNGEIKKTNKYAKMSPPFSYLQDCNKNHYSMQLSVYRNIITAKIGIEMSDGILVHFPDDGTFKVIKCPSYVEEVKMLLHERKREI